MATIRPFRHLIVAAFLLTLGLSAPVDADESVSDLLESLQSASPDEAKRLDRQITAAWARSGSAAMDLLLRRGRKALDEDEIDVAIEHFTALTDHAPDFAEGWHGLARAYFEAELYGPTVDALGHALSINPDHYPAIFGLGVMFMQFDEPARAEKAFNEVLRLNPHHEDAKQALERLKSEGVGRTL